MNYNDKDEFIKRCDDSSDILIEEDLVDIYLNQPVCTFYYIDDEKSGVTKLSQYNISVKLINFKNLSDIKSYIDFHRVNNYFLAYSINRKNKNAHDYSTKNDQSFDLRCAFIPIEIKLFGREHISKARVRDKKINEILK